MTDKRKTVTCLILFVAALLIYLSEVVFQMCYWDEFFHGLLNFYVTFFISIFVTIINVITCIACTIFLVQKIRYRNACLSILLCSFIFMIYVILIFGSVYGPIFLYSPDEEEINRFETTL